MSKFTALVIVIALLTISLFGVPASAASYTWDTSATGGIQAGSGTWGADSFWTTNGSTLVAWPGSANDATFAGADGAYAITVSGTQAALGVTFTNAGYTLSGGTLSILGSGLAVNANATINSTINIGASQDWTLAASKTLTIGSQLTRGTGIVNFSMGAGSTVALAASNTNTNGILGGWATVNGADFATVSSGTIAALSSYTALPTSGASAATNYVVSSNTTLTASQTVNALKINPVASSTLTMTGYTLTLNSGGLLINSSSAQTITAGTLTAGTSPLYISKGTNAGLTISSTLGGTGGVVIRSASIGSVALSAAANTFTGGLYASNVQINAGDAALGAAGGAVTLDYAQLYSGGTTYAASRTITLASGGGYFQVGANQTSTIASKLTGPGVAGFAWDGNTTTGTIYVLSNTGNDYTGETRIGTKDVNYYAGTAATLKLGANNVIPYGAGKGNVVVGYTAQGTAIPKLDLGGYSANINGLTTNNATYAVVDNTSGAGTYTLTLGNGDATATYGGVIKSTSGSLAITKTGLGVQTLSGSNTYKGATTIGQGTIKSGNIYSLGTGTTNVGTAGTLDLGGVGVIANNLTGSGTIDNLTGSSTYTLTANNSAASTFGGIIKNTSGTLALTKTGAGVLTLTGTSTYTGVTTIGQGAIIGSTTGTLAGLGTPGRIVVNSGGALGGQMSGWTEAQILNLYSQATFNSGSYLGIDTTNSSYGWTTALTGTTAIAKFGSNTLSLTTNNSYSGGTLINSGTLAVGGYDTVLGSGSVTVTGNSALQAIDTRNLANNISFGTNTLTIDTQANNLTLSGSLIGSSAGSALVKNGAGTLTLSSSSSAGILTLNAGTINLAADLTFGKSGDGGTQFNGTGGTISSSGGRILLAGGNASTNGADWGGTAGGVYTISAPMVNGPSAYNNVEYWQYGTFIIQGANTYTGGTLMNGGTVRIGVDSVGSVGAVTSGAFGTGAITWAGGTISSDGTANRNIINALTLKGAVTVGDATNNGKLTFSAPTSLTAASTLTVSSPVEFSGAISGTYSLSKTGSDLLTLSASNSYTGGTILSAGVLQAANNYALGTGSVTTSGSSCLQLNGVTLSNPITLSATGGYFNASNIEATGGVASQLTGLITLGTASSIKISGSSQGDPNGNNTTLRISGGVTGTQNLNIYSDALNTSITVDTTPINIGTATLSGHNLYINVAGNTVGTYQNLYGYTTYLGVDNAFTGAPALVLGNGNGTGTLDLQGHTQTFGSLTASSTGSYINSDIITSSGTVTGSLIVSNTGASSYAGVINGNLALTKSNSGTLTLTGSNSYSGGTVISGGTLQLGAGGTTGSIAGDILNNAALSFNRSDTLTYSGNITGSGAVNQTGAGMLILTGSSNYGGGTTLAAGVLNVQNSSALGTGAVTISGAGAQLQLQGGVTLANSTSITSTSGSSGYIYNVSGTNTLSGPITMAANAGVYFASAAGLLNISGTVDTGGHSVTFLGNGDFTMSNSTYYYNLTKQGNGTLLLGGSNAFASAAGTVSLQAGTLKINNANALTGAVTTAISNGATLDLNGFSQTLKELTGSSGTPIINNSGAAPVTLTLSNTGTNTFAGVIQNSGNALSLAKTNSGTLILAGANTYTGLTTISGGTLQLGNGGTAGSVAGNILNNAALAFNRSDTFTYSGNITGSGAVNQNGSGLVILAGNSGGFTGTTTVNSGALISTSTAALPGVGTAGKITVASGAAVGGQIGGAGWTESDFTTLLSNATFNAGSYMGIDTTNGNYTYAGSIAGNQGLAKYGANALTLGNNTYTGPTLINNGSIKIGGASSLANSSSITVNAGGVLDLNGNNQAIQNIGGAGIIDNTSGAGTYTLTLNTTNANTFAGTIQNTSGSLGLTKLGNSNLTLSGSNSFSGPVFISGSGTLLTVSNASALGNTSGVTVSSTGTQQGYLGLGATVSGISLELNATCASGNSARSSIISTASGAWNGPITISGSNGGTQFSTNGYNLTLGGNITGTNDGINTMMFRGATGTGTISGTINTPNANFFKTDGGTWNLNSTGNTWGATGVALGTLKLGVANALPANTVVTMGQNDNGTPILDLNGYDQTIAGLASTTTAGGTAAKTITSTTGTPTLTINVADGLTYSYTHNVAVLAGSLALNKTGNGTQIISGTSTYTGGNLIAGGTLQALASSALKGSATVNSGATLFLNQGNTTWSNTISGGGLVQLNTGATSNNTYITDMTGFTGTVELIGGTAGKWNVSTLAATPSPTATIQVDANSTIFVNSAATNFQSAINLYGGTTGEGYGQVRVDSVTLYSPITLYANSSIGSSNTGNFSGSIGDNGAGFTLTTAAGTTILSASNSYVGNTVINNTTKIANAYAIANSGTITVNSGKTLDLYGTSMTIKELAGAGNIDNLSATPVTLTVNANATDSFTGVIKSSSLAAGGTTNLTMIGSGTLSLGGASTYTGLTTISAGTLKAGNAAAFGAKNNVVLVSPGATLDIGAAIGNATGDYQIQVSGTGVGGFAIINSGSADQQNGLRRVTMTGDTTLGGNGGRFDIRALNASTTRGALDMGGNTLTKAGSNYFCFVDTDITNPGNIVVNGGWLSLQTGSVLNGDSTHSVTVNNGIFDMWGFTGAAPQWTMNLNGGSFQASYSNTNTWAGPVNLLASSNTIAATTAGTTLTISGPVTGGPLTIGGPGNVFLTNTANSYGGTVLTTGGQMVVTTTSNFVSYSGPLSFAGGVLQFGTGSTLTVADVENYYGAINWGNFNGGIDVADAAASVVLPSFTASNLVKGTGAGTMVLGGPSVVTGGLTVYSGTLDLHGNLASPTFTSLASTGGAITDLVSTGTTTLTLNQDTNTSSTAAIKDGAGVLALYKSGTGTLTLGGYSNYSGGTTIAAGTIAASSSRAFGAPGSTITILDGAALDTKGMYLSGTPGNYSPYYTIVVSGSGVNGTGALLNTGANQQLSLANVTMTGNVLQNLAYEQDIRSSTSTTLNMNGFTWSKTGAGLACMVNMQVTNPGHFINNQGETSIEGSSNLGGSAANTYTVNSGAGLYFYNITNTPVWTLNLNGGALQNYSGTPTWAGPVNLQGLGVSNTMDTRYNSAAGATMTLSNTVSGNGFTKINANALVLTGSNNYTGQTYITGGAVRAVDGVGLPTTSNLSLNGGTFELLNGGVFNRNLGTNPGEVQIAGAGGFGAYGASGTVSLNGGAPIAWGQAGFTPTNLTLNGATANNAINLQNNIDLNNTGVTVSRTISSYASTAYVNGVLSNSSGTANLVIAGANATVMLTNNNTYTGNTTINTGGAVLALGATSGYAVLSPTININSATTGQASLRFVNNNQQFNPDTTTLVFLSGTSGQSAKMDLQGNTVTVGKWVLTNTASTNASVIQNYEGVVASNTGTLVVSNTSALMWNQYMRSGSSGVLALTKTNSGTLTLAGANITYTGQTTIGQGTLILNGATGFNSPVYFSANGTMDIASALKVPSLSSNGAVGITEAAALGGGSVTLTINQSGTATYGGILRDNADTTQLVLTKTGAGTQILTGSSSYTGGTTLSAGTLLVGNDNALGTGTIAMSSGTILGSDGTAHALGNAITISGLATLGATGGTGPLTLNGGLTMLASSTLNILSDQSLPGGIFGGYALTKTGAGTLSLSSTMITGWSGGTTIQQGMITLSNSAASGQHSAPNMILTNGGLGVNFTGVQGFLAAAVNGASSSNGVVAISSLAASESVNFQALGLTNAFLGAIGSVNYTGAYTPGTAGAYRLGGGGGDLYFNSNLLTGSNTLIVGNGQAGAVGAGRLFLSASSGWTGGTILNSGTLMVSGPAVTLGTGAVTLNGGELNISNTAAINYNRTLTLGGASTVTIDRPAGSPGAGYGITFASFSGNANSTLTVQPGANITSGGVTMSITGGTWYPNGKNFTFNVLGDATTLNLIDTITSGGQTTTMTKNGSGTLVIGGGNNTWDSGSLIINSGTVTLTNQFSVGGPQMAITANAGTTLRLAVDTGTYFGYVSGQSNGAFTIGGDNALLITDRYTSGAGVTHAEATLATSGAYTVNIAGGNMVTSGTQGLAIAGATTLGGNTVFNVTNPVNGGVTMMSFSGAIGGNYSLTKAGNGLMVMNGTSTYTGGTTISSGTLIIGGAGLLGSGAYAAAISNGGALIYNSSANQTFSGSLSGTGALTHAGNGSLTLSSSNSYSGGTTLSGSGVLAVGNSYALGTGAINLYGTKGTSDSNATLSIAGSNINLANAINLNSMTGRESIASSVGSNVLSSLVTVSGTAGNTIILTNNTAGTLFTMSGSLVAPTFTQTISLRGSSGALGLLTGQILAPNATVDSNVGGHWTIASTGNTWSVLNFMAASTTISVGADDALCTSARILFSANNNSALNLGGYNQTVAGLDQPIQTSGSTRITNYGSSDSILTLAGLTTSRTFAGAITDGNTNKVSLVMNSAGRTQVLGGNNTYTGSTVIHAGTLALGAAGSLASPTIVVGDATSSGAVLDVSAITGGWTVASGQRLMGKGTIHGTTILGSGAISAPGNSVDTQTFDAMTLNNGLILEAEFNSTPANDKWIVTNDGGLTINGGAFKLYDEGTTNTFSTSGTYNLIQYVGALNGSISNLSVDPSTQVMGKAYQFGTSGGWVTLSILDYTTAVLALSNSTAHLNMLKNGTIDLSAYVKNDSGAIGDDMAYTLTGDITGSGTLGHGVGATTTVGYNQANYGSFNLSVTANASNVHLGGAASNSPNSFGMTIIAGNATAGDGVFVDANALYSNVANTGSYANLASKVTAGPVGKLGSEAIITAGTAAADRLVSMNWRTRTADESDMNKNNHHAVMPADAYNLLSDVVQLAGTGDDSLTLKVFYDPGQLTAGYSESYLAGANKYGVSWIYLAKLNDISGVWEKVAGSQTVNTTDHWVTATITHDGTYAVVPEPGTMALLLVGGVGVLLRRRRKA